MVRSGPVHTGAQTPLARAGALPRTSQADAEIGGGLGAATTSEAQAAAEAQVETSACAALTLEEMSTFGSSMVMEVGDLLADQEKASGIMSMILSPIIMMMIMGSSRESSKKSKAGVGATVVDIIVIVLTASLSPRCACRP